MRTAASILALILNASPAFSGGRLGAIPLRAPNLAPTLAAPIAPSLAPLSVAPSLVVLAAPTAPAMTLPTPAVSRIAAAAPPLAATVPAKAKPAVFETLAVGTREVQRAEGAQRATVLNDLFNGNSRAPVNAVAVPTGDFPSRSALRFLPAATRTAAAAIPSNPHDSDGSRMRAALRELQGRSEPLAIDFTPTPASLKELAGLNHEVFLYRERGIGVWRLAGGDRWSVSGDFGDYDLGLHNHPETRLGIHSTYSPFPSPVDFLNAAGKKARVFVVSQQGVAEWNTTTPFIDEPGRYLEAGASEAEQKTWLHRLEDGSFWRRLVMRLSFPSGYPTLAKSLGLAMELRPWRRVSQEWLDSGSPPETPATQERRMAAALSEEAALAARRLAGRALSAAEQADVTRRTRLVAVNWSKILFNEFGVMASYPDGVARHDLTIELTLKKASRLPDPQAYYRILFAHEYTHRLQFEGDVTSRWGIEIPPVAVELLRAVELVGMDGLKAGKIPFITEHVLEGLESGRRWADGERKDDMGFYHKGTLAGAAWELAGRTGRSADAWEFVRRVSSARQSEAPGRVYADILERPL